MASKVRTNHATNLWTAPATWRNYGREDFRFHVDRSKRRLPKIGIDPWVQTADWQRQAGDAHIIGDLNFYRPLGAHAASLIANGDWVVCECSHWGTGGPWRRLWRMKIVNPSHQVRQGLITLTLSSVLDVLTGSKVAWKFKQNKAHPHGWTADQITRDVCGRFRIPHGHIAKGTWHVHSYMPKSASPQDVINWAYGQEHKHTGRRFNIDSSTGVLNVTELREPRYLLILGAGMLDATVEQSIVGITSAINATVTHKDGKKTHKLKAKVVDQGRLSEYGYIVRHMTAPQSVKSQAALRHWAKQRLATMYRAKKTLSFSHPGIPLMDRGTALRAYVPEADLSQIVFVTDIQQSLSAGSYQMQVDVGFDDPWSADQARAKVQQKKDAAAARRKRKAAAKKAAAAKAKKARVRSNA